MNRTYYVLFALALALAGKFATPSWAASTIPATVTTKTGEAYQAAISTKFPFNQHAQLRRDIASDKQLDCLLFGFVAKCLNLRTSFYSDDPNGTGYPNDKRLFVRPISLISIWLSGRQNDNDYGKLLSEVSGQRQPVPVPLVGKPITFYNAVIGDEYFVSTYQTSFEPAAIVQDGQLALKRLDDMLGRDFPSPCPGPELSNYSMGYYCSGVFRWTADDARRGHAWCKYMSPASERSAPFDCVALSITTPSETYIRAFASPFYGEGFGQGVGGVNCEGKPPIAFSEDNVMLVNKMLETSPMNVTMRQPRRINSAFYQLTGERRNVRSLVIPNVFEWTTYSLAASNIADLGLSIFGEIVPAISGTIMANLGQARNLDEADLNKYKVYFERHLSATLSQAFGQRVDCSVR